jgi:hypothetical protein
VEIRPYHDSDQQGSEEEGSIGSHFRLDLCSMLATGVDKGWEVAGFAILSTGAWPDSMIGISIEFYQDTVL